MSNANRLAEILNKSKAVMNKTDQEYGTIGNPTTSTPTAGHVEKEMPNLTGVIAIPFFKYLLFELNFLILEYLFL